MHIRLPYIIAVFVIGCLGWYLYPKGPVVLYVGDSLTVGTFVQKPYWKQLRSLAMSHQVYTSARNGARSAEGISLLQAGLSDTKPDLIVIQLGANDYLSGLDLRKAQDNLRELIELAKQHAKAVIILGIDPKYGNIGFDLYGELAEETNAYYVEDILANVYNQPQLLLRDGMHPNPDGHRVMAQNILPTLNAALKYISTH